VSFLDAHNHLHDARLEPNREPILTELSRIGLERAVVNGTREDDWPAVRQLADQHSWVVPSYGLHPWYAPELSTDWLDALKTYLVSEPRAAVGEIGLDRWIEGHDLAVQTPVFIDQLALAVEFNRAATIHCVRAWGALEEVVRTHETPPRGFLLHAYAGPVEMIRNFVERGAYFSFSPYFLNERKAAQREAFRHIPLNRILVETDAPDLRPPDSHNPRPLTEPGGKPINHPANIDVAYRGLAEIRGEPIERPVAENFARLFL
jgi:TatD DNase family protein